MGFETRIIPWLNEFFLQKLLSLTKFLYVDHVTRETKLGTAQPRPMPLIGHQTPLSTFFRDILWEESLQTDGYQNENLSHCPIPPSIGR